MKNEKQTNKKINARNKVVKMHVQIRDCIHSIHGVSCIPIVPSVYRESNPFLIYVGLRLLEGFVRMCNRNIQNASYDDFNGWE